MDLLTADTEPVPRTWDDVQCAFARAVLELHAALGVMRRYADTPGDYGEYPRDQCAVAIRKVERLLGRARALGFVSEELRDAMAPADAAITTLRDHYIEDGVPYPHSDAARELQTVLAAVQLLAVDLFRHAHKQASEGGPPLYSELAGVTDVDVLRQLQHDSRHMTYKEVCRHMDAVRDDGEEADMWHRDFHRRRLAILQQRSFTSLTPENLVGHPLWIIAIIFFVFCCAFFPYVALQAHGDV